MPDKTTNYNLIKPLANENYDVGVQNGNMDAIDVALTPTAVADKVPAAPAVNSPAKLLTWLSWILNRIKAITGKANWWDAPVKSIEDLNTDVTTHLADETKHSTPETAKIKTGTGTFTTGGVTHTITDAFCITSSWVEITITGAIKPQGKWSVDSQNGKFVITSNKSETVNIPFNYAIFKGGV